MTATRNRLPARLPQNVTNQCNSILPTLSLLCSTLTVVYMKLPVQRSVPVSTIMHRPYGNTSAASTRIRPGAFSWYHGDELTVRSVAQAKDKSMPAITADMKTLSRRMCALATPAREMSSILCRAG